MTIKDKIKFGKVEIPDEAFHPKSVKERITIMLDQDVVDSFRAQALETGIGYQTLINRALRGAMAGTPRLTAAENFDFKKLEELAEHAQELSSLANLAPQIIEMLNERKPKAKRRG